MCIHFGPAHRNIFILDVLIVNSQFLSMRGKHPKGVVTKKPKFKFVGKSGCNGAPMSGQCIVGCVRVDI